MRKKPSDLELAQKRLEASTAKLVKVRTSSPPFGVFEFIVILVFVVVGFFSSKYLFFGGF